jgi:hypothetical protein
MDCKKQIIRNSKGEIVKILAFPPETIDDSEIAYTDEEGDLCAKNGLATATSGTNWKLVKDFKGKPKHSEGGVDIELTNKGVTISRDKTTKIKAKFGLLIPKL